VEGDFVQQYFEQENIGAYYGGVGFSGVRTAHYLDTQICCREGL
jgi:hypothetical protein